MKNLVEENNSIVNVSKSVLKHYGCYQEDDTIDELDRYLADGSDHVIYMLLDGLGMNVLNHHLSETSFLRRHLLHRVTSVFPPTTVAATNAVLAAKAPVETGYLGWIQYDPEENLDIQVFLNTDFYTGRKAGRNYRKQTLSYPSILDRVRESHPEIETFELFPAFMPGGSKTFGEHLDRLDHVMRTHEKTFSYAYWTEPDLSLHEKGVNHPDIGRIIRDLNHQIEVFTDIMPNRSTLIIIADHGLVDVLPIPLHRDEKLFSYLQRKPSLEPRATNFFVKPEFLEAFESHFKMTYGSDYELMSRTCILNEKIFGSGKPHPTIARTLGDFVAIATTDKMFTLKDGVPFKAHHAGMTKDEMDVPLIVYRT